MLLVLLGRGITLPGAGQGIIYYLKPNHTRLADPQVHNDTLLTVFFFFFYNHVDVFIVQCGKKCGKCMFVYFIRMPLLRIY